MKKLTTLLLIAAIGGYFSGCYILPARVNNTNPTPNTTVNEETESPTEAETEPYTTGAMGKYTETLPERATQPTTSAPTEATETVEQSELIIADVTVSGKTVCTEILTVLMSQSSRRTTCISKYVP